MSQHERDQACVAFYLGGASMQAVGDLFGVTRERVRQILKQRGITAVTRGRFPSIDPIRVVGAIRSPGIENFVDAGKLVGATGGGVRRIAISLGVHKAALRLFRMRRRARYARQLRTLADRLKRTPGKIECDLYGPSQATLQRWFGGMQAAQRAAGLVPNGVGRRRYDRMRGAA